MPTPQQFYKTIPFFRGAIAFLTLACFITLFSYPKSSADPFNILQQLALNACLLFAYSYSLYSNNSPHHRPLSPVYRMSLICTAFVLSWVYGMGPLVMILGNRGCNAERFADAPGRCVMQLSVSSVEVVWTVLMFVEGLLTDRRNRDKAYRQEMGWTVQEEDHVLASRARAAQAAAEANGVVEYRPDLSLEGAGGEGPGTGAGRRRVVGVEDGDNDGGDLEMEEPLPPYMPKARSNQAVIIDMTNLRPPHQQTQQQQQQPEVDALQDHSPSHHAEEQEDTQGRQQEQVQQQIEQTASLGGVSMSSSPSSSSSSSTIAPPLSTQLPPLQPGQQQHPEAIHPRGGPGTGLPRVPSYSE